MGVAAPPRKGRTRGDLGIDLPEIGDTGGGGGGSDWVELARAHDDIDAHLLVGRLTAAGIETRTLKDRSAPGAWLYGGVNPWAPVEVFVRPVQLEDARLVLAEISFENPPAEQQSYPSTPARMSRSVLWWATALALGVVLTAIALLQVAREIGPCQLRVFCGAPVTVDH